MNRNDIVHIVAITGVLIIAIIASFDNKWEMATAFMTGAFALLKTKGDENEKNPVVPTDSTNN